MDPMDECLSDYKYGFSPDLLKGQVAFVTGGGSGIGFTIAELLMRHGCQVVIASRNEERLRAAAQKLSSATGQRCLTCRMDVRKPADIQMAMDKVLSEFGRLDILINNAAGNFLCPASSLSPNAFRTVMEIDAQGVFNCSKAAYETYFKDHGGVILNISATLPYRGTMLQTHAGAAKAAIDAITKHLAVEWGPQGIRVVGVAPGPIKNTEGIRRLAGDMESQVAEAIPLQCMGEKADVGHSVLYLVSWLGKYITGTNLVVDGGSWLTQANGVLLMRFMHSSGESKL